MNHFDGPSQRRFVDARLSIAALSSAPGSDVPSIIQGHQGDILSIILGLQASPPSPDADARAARRYNKGNEWFVGHFLFEKAL